MRRPRSFTGPDGTRWRIAWRRPPAAYGAHAVCIHAERLIMVDPALDDETLAAALADEVCHAHFPALDNECVDAFSDALARLLARVGYSTEEGAT